MLAELLQKLHDFANLAVNPAFEIIDGIEDPDVLHYRHGSATGTIDKPKPKRESVAESLESLALLCCPGECPSVYHSGNTAVVVLDDRPSSRRRDRITWQLRDSEKFTALAKQASVHRTHSEFVRFLELNFSDEIEAAAPGLLTDIRTLKFITSDEERGDVQRGRESMGRDIDSELTGADKLPPTVTLTVPRWAELSKRITCRIKCRLQVDCQDRKLSLVPLADEVAEAEIAAHSAFALLLAGAAEDCELTDLRIYHGKP